MAHRLVHGRARVRGRRRFVGSPECTERGGSEAGGGGAVAGRVGDREPGTVAVLDEVEPVAADS